MTVLIREFLSSSKKNTTFAPGFLKITKKLVI